VSYQCGLFASRFLIKMFYVLLVSTKNDMAPPRSLSLTWPC